MSTQRKGVLSELTAKAFLLQDSNVLTILEPLKAYGIIDILLVTKDYKIKCYDVKTDSLRRIYRQLNNRQKEFLKKNNVEFGIIYVGKKGKCTIKNYKQ